MRNKGRYRRLDRAERAAIERGLDAGRSARAIAADLGRSPSSIADEVRRNRSVAKGPGKGGRAGEPPEGACPRLLSWPRACNGCKYRRYHCSRRWKCEYSAARAQRLADEALSESRKGVDFADERDFERVMETIRGDVTRGLSPAQIARARAGEVRASTSTIYRWIEAGYAGMSNLELRRKVGYRPRRRSRPAGAASRDPRRSFTAFSALPESQRERAAEMDTVIGLARDEQCLLTLYLRPCRFQVVMLLPEKTASAVASALDSLEEALGKEAFWRLFGLILTDNGAEFSDPTALERSRGGGGSRCSVYYCDPRQSQQKGGCERNHVELRKILPKGRGISFDDLEPRDAAVLMSHLNSEPRPSLMGMTPIAMLRAADPEAAGALLGALGVEEVPYERLLLKVSALDSDRAERGLAPLV